MRQPRVDAARRAYAPWPPDDSEESVVGSEFHQRVIDGARDGLDMASLADPAWWVQSQIALRGFHRPDGSPYIMLPDVFVHPRPNPHPRSGETLSFAEVGVPLLVIEVLSESTRRQDLDERGGKAWSYAEAGVAELLLVDFDCRYMPEPVRALRLAERRWTPWALNDEGRWVSAALGVSFSFDSPYLRVHDAQGRLMPLPHEANSLLMERDARLRDRERELRTREEQLQERDARWARLRILAAAGDFAAIQALLANDALSE
ncbi:MAG TPA: Uma2 family endonuclease [Chloroflexota bacterium]|nr:Uma2 family endonuclease [Chloroflexota bacterium]